MGKSGILAPERSYGYGRDVVEERAEGEPDWLAARRFEAWDVYEATPLPTTRGEDWRWASRWTSMLRLLGRAHGCRRTGPATPFSRTSRR